MTGTADALAGCAGAVDQLPVPLELIPEVVEEVVGLVFTGGGVPNAGGAGFAKTAVVLPGAGLPKAEPLAADGAPSFQPAAVAVCAAGAAVWPVGAAVVDFFVRSAFTAAVWSVGALFCGVEEMARDDGGALGAAQDPLPKQPQRECSHPTVAQLTRNKAIKLVAGFLAMNISFLGTTGNEAN